MFFCTSFYKFDRKKRRGWPISTRTYDNDVTQWMQKKSMMNLIYWMRTVSLQERWHTNLPRQEIAHEWINKFFYKNLRELSLKFDAIIKLVQVSWAQVIRLFTLVMLITVFIRVFSSQTYLHSALHGGAKVKPCPHWRLQSPNSATVTVFGDCRQILWQIVAVSGDYSRILPLWQISWPSHSQKAGNI